MQNITVDLRSRKQLYEQLIDNIRRLILAGEIKPGERLPSVRALAKDLCINPNTIQKAYAELERQGVILTLPGRGSVVLAETEELHRAQCERIIKMVMPIAMEARSTGISRKEFLELVTVTWNTVTERMTDGEDTPDGENYESGMQPQFGNTAQSETGGTSES